MLPEFCVVLCTLATSCEELTHWKRPWCWEGLGAGGEGDDRGWDGWMTSPTRWTWVWVNSRSCWWTGRPGVLQFMGSQRVGHDWSDWTELNWMYSFPPVRYFCPLSAGVCMHFCIWRCIPDVSMERDLLHVHLLLCHLPPYKSIISIKILLSSISWIMSCTLFWVGVFTNLGDHGQALSFPKSHAGGLVGLHWPGDLLPPSPSSLQVILSP